MRKSEYFLRITIEIRTDLKVLSFNTMLHTLVHMGKNCDKSPLTLKWSGGGGEGLI